MVVPRMPTKVAMYPGVNVTWGTTVARRTVCQSGSARMPAPMYARRTNVSHLKLRAMRRYEDQKSSETIRPA